MKNSRAVPSLEIFHKSRFGPPAAAICLPLRGCRDSHRADESGSRGMVDLGRKTGHPIGRWWPVMQPLVGDRSIISRSAAPVLRVIVSSYSSTGLRWRSPGTRRASRESRNSVLGRGSQFRNRLRYGYSQSASPECVVDNCVFVSDSI